VYHLALADEVLYRLPGVIDGNRETQADVAACRGRNPRVHSDDLAVDIHEGAARVALVDGRVRLDIVGIGCDISLGPVAPERAHDAHRDRGLVAERVANGKYDVTHLNRVRVSHLRHRNG